MFAETFAVYNFNTFSQPMGSNATLKKIAESLGISISTVSRALKNHPDISQKTKNRVKELAETLDYEPNANAVNLRSSKSNLFGLIVPGISNFFYDAFISAVEEECRRTGYSLMVLQSGDHPVNELENLKLCRQNRVSGIFVCLTRETRDMEPFLRLRHHDIPVIFFDKVPETPNTNRVCVADEEAARLAARSLLEKKKKKILALFGSPKLLITQKRRNAFEQTIGTQASITCLHAETLEQSAEIARTELNGKYDAVFCMSDEILTGLMKVVQEKNITVPDALGIIAISNGFFPTLYHPEITYVETSGSKLGKLAFSMMLAALSGSHLNQELSTETVLVPGNSL